MMRFEHALQRMKEAENEQAARYAVNKENRRGEAQAAGQYAASAAGEPEAMIATARAG